jgi:GNAT superfamily N-acetyltransferase
MTIDYRPGSLADSFTVYQIFEQALQDLGQRLNVMAITGGNDPEVMARLWERRRPLFEHLARTADQFWIAQVDGQAVGFARSIVRAATWELTEFFVRPGQQSAGVGRELLARVAPPAGTRHRTIIATTDQRAQARYLKLGVYPRFPLYYFSRQPQAVPVPADVIAEPLTATPETLALLARIDQAVIGHARDADHAWLLAERKGFLYRLAGEVLGYGYVGYRSGPFALLDERYFPAVLAHAEAEAARQGLEEFGVEVPMINAAAVTHLLARGFRFDAFFAYFMSDAPYGRFERYLFMSPPFFV